MNGRTQITNLSPFLRREETPTPSSGRSGVLRRMRGKWALRADAATGRRTGSSGAAARALAARVPLGARTTNTSDAVREPQHWVPHAQDYRRPRCVRRRSHAIVVFFILVGTSISHSISSDGEILVLRYLLRAKLTFSSPCVISSQIDIIYV